MKLRCTFHWHYKLAASSTVTSRKGSESINSNMRTGQQKKKQERVKILQTGKTDTSLGLQQTSSQPMKDTKKIPDKKDT